MTFINHAGFGIMIFACKDEFSSSTYLIGQISLGSAYDIALNGDYAYVAYNDGLAVIDIIDPAKPKKLFTLKTAEAAFGILVDDNRLYVGSAGENNLYIYDNSNPQNPTTITFINLSGTVTGITRNEDYLFVSTQNGYLEVLSISDLSNIIKVKTICCQGQGMDIVYYKGYAYYANSHKGLHVINVSDPSNPVIITTVTGTSGAWDVHINEDHLFLTKHMYGFNSFSLENPALPVKVTNKSNGGESYGIYTEESNLYIADLQQGVELWDNSDINNPLLLKTGMDYAPHDIAAKNDLILFADQDKGFVILKY